MKSATDPPGRSPMGDHQWTEGQKSGKTEEKTWCIANKLMKFL